MKVQLNKRVIKGSLVLLITFNLFNVLNFLYNIVMVRMLDLADYGTLTVLIYILVMLAVFTESVQTVLSHYCAKENDEGKVKNIAKRSLRKVLKVSFVFFMVYGIFSLLLSRLLSIPYSLLLITGLAIFPFLITSVNRGILLGRKFFWPLGWNLVLEGAIKLVTAILLVYLSFEVYGAVAGVLIGSAIACIFSFLSLRKIFKAKEQNAVTPKIYSYSRPVFFTTLIVTTFFSLDIILAKLFFSSEKVGIYAIASILAKILFIGVQPISKAMFPISTEENGEKKSSRTLATSALILSSLAICGIIIVILIPEILVYLYSGRIIEESVSILLPLIIGSTALSLANLMLLYKLSVGKTKNYGLLGIFIVIEIALVYFFHDSLWQFSLAIAAASIIFLLGSLILPRK